MTTNVEANTEKLTPKEILGVMSQLRGIETQLLQKDGYPFDLANLKRALHFINHGLFFEPKPIIIKPNPKFEVIAYFPVIFSKRFDLKKFVTQFKENGWYFDPLIAANVNEIEEYANHLWPKGARKLAVICSTNNSYRQSEALQFISDQGGEVYGFPALLMAFQFGWRFFPEDKLIQALESNHHYFEYLNMMATLKRPSKRDWIFRLMKKSDNQSDFDPELDKSVHFMYFIDI